MDYNKELQQLFYNPKNGFVSIDKLYKKAKQLYPNITHKLVKNFYKNQEVNQVLKQTKNNKFSSIRSKYPGYKYQIDLMVYNRFKIHNYQYILVVIDVYSRFAQARPLTNRNISTIIKNYNDIIKIMGPPFKIDCDNEFNNEKFIKNALSQNTQYFQFSNPDEPYKNAIVERFNGTLALLLQKIRIGTNDKLWYKYLDDAIDNYNNTYHSTVKHTPLEIFTEQQFNDQDYITYDKSFNIGDNVRIKKIKSTFDKGDVITYSTKIYSIEGYKNGKYKISDNTTLFKPDQLQHITLSENPINQSTEYLIEKKKALQQQKRQLKKDGIDTNNIIHSSRKRN